MSTEKKSGEIISFLDALKAFASRVYYNTPWFALVVTILGISTTMGMLFLYLDALVQGASTAMNEFGLKFFFSTTWNPVTEDFGALPFIIGTILTSTLSIIFAVPLGVAVSLFITEYAPRNIKDRLRLIADVLAAIPSVIYGLWGIFVLGPFISSFGKMILSILMPQAYVRANSIFTASVILTIMILPILINILVDAFETVPDTLKEGMYSLGSTKWEVTVKVVIKSTYPTIAAATLLALARALGETMAVTMVIGNAYGIPSSIFDAGHTITSIIANEFTEASGQLHLSALHELALILFAITLIFNFLGLLLVKYIRKKFGQAT